MKRIVTVILIIPLLLCSCVKGNDKNGDITHNEIQEKASENDLNYAVWLSFFDISSLCNGVNEKQFRENVINLAANLLSINSKTLIVHAVSFCDSFYESDILPKSRYIKATEDFDVFGIICEICGKAGIEVEAWINPYRVSSEKDFSAIKNNPAVKKIYDKNKTNILINEKEIYLNPASQSVQRLILDETREILTKYPVCAIHIDDYFYPDMSANPDEASYSLYLENKGSLSIENWRRENVNALISSLHILTHSFGKRFVVSPAASIKKNYELKYADISLWLENGWIDEIVPQIYFGFENENAPFEQVLDNWINETKDKSVRLIIGLAFYKCGETDKNAGTGKNEWKENCDIILRQIKLVRGKSTIYGVAFFSYSHIFGKNMKKIAKKELQNIKSML